VIQSGGLVLRELTMMELDQSLMFMRVVFTDSRCTIAGSVLHDDYLHLLSRVVKLK